MITFSVFKENPFSIEIIIFLFYTGNISYNRKKYNSHIGRKFERKTFKLLIGGSTASNACSMQGYKSETGLRKYNYGKGYDKRQNTATDDSICNSSYIGKFISDFI